MWHIHKVFLDVKGHKPLPEIVPIQSTNQRAELKMQLHTFVVLCLSLLAVPYIPTSGLGHIGGTGMARNNENQIVSMLSAVFPLPPEILWGMPWVLSFITWNQYAQYISASFYWVDVSIAFAFGAPACAGVQYTTAFYATVLTYAVLCGYFPPPFVVGLSCLCAAAASLGTQLYLASCNPSLICYSMCIGLFLGVMRVLIYYDAFAPPPRRSLPRHEQRPKV